MSDFFDFLTNNPAAAIFVLFFLYRLLFGSKKKKAQGEQQVQASATTDRKKSFQQRLEDALNQAQTSARQIEGPQTRAAAPVGQRSDSATALEQLRLDAQAASQAAPASKTDDPFAFHSLMDKPLERTDFDLNPSAFSFRTAVNEPVEKEYHLTGFTGFHAVQGMSSGSSIFPVQTEAESSDPPQAESLFGGDGDLRRAIILNEILGRPRAMRRIGM